MYSHLLHARQHTLRETVLWGQIYELNIESHIQKETDSKQKSQASEHLH